MRTFVAATVAATIIASNAFAASDVSKTLPAGKPAGVNQAQGEDMTVWYLVGLGFVGAGVGLIASGDNNANVISGTTATTTSR